MGRVREIRGVEGELVVAGLQLFYSILELVLELYEKLNAENADTVRLCLSKAAWAWKTMPLAFYSQM